MMNMSRSTVFALATCCTFSMAHAAVFHIDPVNGSMLNDGSAATPWSTLAEVLTANLVETRAYSPLPYVAGTSQLIPKNAGAPVHAGDTLLLYDGLHGDAFYRGAYNVETITVMAAPGHTPILSTLHLQAAAKWRLIGLHVSPEPYGTYHGNHLIHFDTHAWHGPARELEVRDCVLYTSANTSAWSAQDWVDRHSDGIRILGKQVLLLNNQLTNVHFGITISGDSSQAIGNSVINFSGDGMRPLGSDLLLEGNTIKNCYDVDANHDDGIQSFTSPGVPLRRVVLRGNTIINFDDPNQPLRGPLQGIGCFDGPFEDWVVENNVVIVDHWHGISLYGAINCVVANNTVIDPTPSVTPGPSWIRIDDTADVISSGCIVANNIANTYSVNGTQISNIALPGTSYALHFVDVAAYDLHLLGTSTAIDAADDTYAPTTDHDGLPRPVGAQSDIGAYEYAGATALEALERTTIAIFPIPTTDRLIVQVPGAAHASTLEVLDTWGRMIAIWPVNGVAIMDVSHLVPGAYMIRSQGVLIGRFIKQ